MLPRVTTHIGMSLDGRLDYGAGDQGLYYEIVMTHFGDQDGLLCGSNTLLAAYANREVTSEGPEAFEPPPPADAQDGRPRLVVVDSRGRIRCWHAIRNEPYWRDPTVLVSEATPQEYLDYLAQRNIDYILTGREKVDLRAALEELNARYRVHRIRVDSGGILNGALLRAGLVDEISVLVTPCLVGGTSPRTMCVAPDLRSNDEVVPLRLTQVERLRGDVLWLRYDVVK